MLFFKLIRRSRERIELILRLLKDLTLCAEQPRKKQGPGFQIVQAPAFFLIRIEDMPDCSVIVNSDMQISRCSRYIRMAGSVPDFGQGATSCKSVADVGVPSVMDSQTFDPLA